MKWNRQTAASFVLSFSATAALAADANAEWAQAQQLFQSGDFNRALPALLSLDKTFPSNVKLHYMIGMSYKNIGKPAQAERELGWVSSYAQDAALKQSALTALSELKSNADLARAKKSEEEKAAALRQPQRARNHQIRWKFLLVDCRLPRLWSTTLSVQRFKKLTKRVGSLAQILVASIIQNQDGRK